MNKIQEQNKGVNQKVYYITYCQPPRYRQLSFEDIMNGIDIEDVAQLKMGDDASTRTVVVDKIPDKLHRSFYYLSTDRSGNYVPPKCNLEQRWFENFVETYKDLIEENDKSKFYNVFPRAKKNGHGVRWISAPQDRLMHAQRALKDHLSELMFTDHHTSAYAYVKHRSTIDAVKYHQSWGSKWFVKFDFHDFFGTYNLEFVKKCFSKIYPLCYVVNISKNGVNLFDEAMSLCFLDGKLPQGTPISPFITNVCMIPFDHRMKNSLLNFDFGSKKDRLVYTRYADDIHISCRVDFDYKKIENFILDVVKWMDAPFILNTEKTHYGSIAGQNWMLGVMLNKDNTITVGHKTKRELKAIVYNYLKDRAQGQLWPIDDLRKLDGKISYYKMVEGDTITELINEKSRKFGVNFFAAIRADINNGGGSEAGAES